MFEDLIVKQAARGKELQIPDFPNQLEWDRSLPLSLASDLLDRLTVLFFWNHRSVNSHHGIRWLKRVQEQLKDPRIAIVGIHVPLKGQVDDKYSVKRAIERYQLDFPQLIDLQGVYSNSLTIKEIPFVLVVSPDQNALHAFRGEEWRYDLPTFLKDALAVFESQHWNTEALEIAPSRQLPRLSYPAGITADPNSGTLFISSGGDHKIHMFSPKGEELGVIGTGLGFEDGGYESCAFYDPRGLSWHQHSLYVADASNHAIRKIDLQAKTVSTVVGLGEQGEDYNGGVELINQHLASPWSLCTDNEGIWISMTGTHQIWRWDFASENCYAYSGLGCPRSLDAREPLAAGWAQPSGICRSGSTLTLADSLTGTVRQLNADRGHSTTLCRSGLSYPLGITWLRADKRLGIADHGKHGIYSYDVQSSSLQRLAGSDEPGHLDGALHEAQFCEPTDLALSPDEEVLYVTDSGNHCVRAIHRESATVTTLVRA